MASVAQVATAPATARPAPLFRQALGSDFDKLHPLLQQQYGFTSADNACFVGEGVMEQVWHGPLYVPFLMVGAMRRVMFPETGRNIPFTVRNYAYTDGLGRETLTWTREFKMPRPRRFDETMVYAPHRSCIVVYAGTHQHLAVDLFIEAGPGGELRFRTGAQRLYEKRVAFRFPMLFSGSAVVTERVNENKGQFEVDVAIRNRLLGGIFGYRGSFKGGLRACSQADVPSDVKPVREERRT